MSEKIKDILQMPEVPDELKPENIPVLLEAKGKRKKKIRIAVQEQLPQLQHAL